MPGGIHSQGAALEIDQAIGGIHHIAPRRRRRYHAEAEIAQRGFTENGVGDGHGRHHHQNRNGIRQQVAKQPATRRQAQHLGGQHKIAFAQGETLSAHQPRQSGPLQQAEHHHHHINARVRGKIELGKHRPGDDQQR
jgi:hypothetical protein